jgi:hypothetical protein
MNFVKNNKKFIQNNPLNEKEGCNFLFSRKFRTKRSSIETYKLGRISKTQYRKY